MILFCAAYAKYTWCHWLYKTILRLNHFLFLFELLLFLTSAFSKIHFLFSLIKHIKIYFLIRFARTKITLFSSTTGLISKNESFLPVEPRSRVTCYVEIKLQFFFRKYIFCTVSTVLTRFISAFFYNTLNSCRQQLLEKTDGLRYQNGAIQ